MAIPLPFLSKKSPAVVWSVGVGVYMFLWGILTTFILRDIISIFAEVIGLPPNLALVIIPSPLLVIGTVLWWLIIERRSAFSYVNSIMFGLSTALITAIGWTGRFIDVWSMDMLLVPMVLYIAGMVFGIVSLVGSVAGIPIIYWRQQYHHNPE